MKHKKERFHRKSKKPFDSAGNNKTNGEKDMENNDLSINETNTSSNNSKTDCENGNNAEKSFSDYEIDDDEDDDEDDSGDELDGEEKNDKTAANQTSSYYKFQAGSTLDQNNSLKNNTQYHTDNLNESVKLNTQINPNGTSYLPTTATNTHKLPITGYNSSNLVNKKFENYTNASNSLVPTQFNQEINNNTNSAYYLQSTSTMNQAAYFNTQNVPYMPAAAYNGSYNPGNDYNSATAQQFDQYYQNYNQNVNSNMYQTSLNPKLANYSENQKSLFGFYGYDNGYNGNNGIPNSSDNKNEVKAENFYQNQMAHHL
jgi:hypothetical protein